MKAYHFIIALVGVALSSCSTQQNFTSPNFNQLRSSHREIAILPFDVAFNSTANREKESVDKRMTEQERQGALDLQKDLFLNIAKQIQKGRIMMRIQDFNKTNKILADKGVRINQVAMMDKGELARILGVDAVLWGHSQVIVSRRSSFGGPSFRDGVESEVRLFDAATGEMIWSTNSFQRPTHYLDTPHRLATSSISQVAKEIPYRIDKRQRI